MQMPMNIDDVIIDLERFVRKHNPLGQEKWTWVNRLKPIPILIVVGRVAVMITHDHVFFALQVFELFSLVVIESTKITQEIELVVSGQCF